MRSNRTPRDHEVRDYDKRETYDMDYKSRLSTPDGVKKDGYSYLWARKEVKGQDDYRLEELIAKGWKPVPADRIPGRASDPLNRNPLSKEFFCTKDLILLEREEIYTQREIDAQHNFSNNKLKSLRGVSNDMGSFTRAAPSINSF